MRRRHLFTILAAALTPAAQKAAANQQPPPDDNITALCDLIARYLDRETASDSAYEVLMAILRHESRPFDPPDWLAEDEFWQYLQRVERKQMKKAGIAASQSAEKLCVMLPGVPESM
jgi:hypothetical protein